MKYLISLLFITILLQAMSQDFDTLNVEPYSNKTQFKNWPNTVFYSVFLQSFYDSNGDGIGDINGLRQKLDYLKELGIGGIWLLPIHPSPSYHKYDVSDYYGIHPDYGTMDDFKNLVTEAHQKGIKIIIDLVINHTSDQIEWFQKAMKGDEKYINYYVWTDDENLIAKEENHWHEPIKATTKALKGKEYYGFFWHEMPDLNFDNQDVREEIKKIGKFWLEDIGIDGFRLDAIRFIYPEEEKEKNHAWWQEFRTAMEEVNPDFYMVAEIWGKDTIVAPFLNKGVHAGFNFDVSFKIIESLKEGTDKGIIDKLIESRNLYQNTYPGFYDAVFLTNHDQNRIMSELQGNSDLSKVAASILLTLPGSPFIYYGEEIGMLGVKPDEQIREPFLWDLPGKEKGQTTWIEAQYSTPDAVPPLILQKRLNKGVYSHYNDLILLRNNSDALTLGDIKKVEIENNSIIAYERNYEKERVLIMHNIGKEGKMVELPKDFLGFNTLIFSSMEKLQRKGLKLFLEKQSSVILTY
jgi:alpha-amylase